MFESVLQAHGHNQIRHCAGRVGLGHVWASAPGGWARGYMGPALRAEDRHRRQRRFYDP